MDPKVFLDQTWQKLDKALDTIFRQGDIDFSLEELYRGVENICRQNMAKEIKERLILKCKDYVGARLKAKVKESLARTNVDVLRATLQAWTTWKQSSGEHHLPSINTKLLTSCRNTSIGSSATSTAPISFPDTSPSAKYPLTSSDLLSLIIQNSVNASLTALATLLQPTEVVPTLTAKCFLGQSICFHDMQVYTRHFEPQMLEFSQEYIMKWADTESIEKALPEYVRSSRALLDREIKRVEMFSLPNTTKRDLLTLLEDLLISRKEARLSGLPTTIL